MHSGRLLESLLCIFNGSIYIILVQKRISASYEPWGSLFKNEKSLPGDQRKATGEAPQGRDKRAESLPGIAMEVAPWNWLRRCSARLCYPFLHNCSSMPFVFEKRPPWLATRCSWEPEFWAPWGIL
jgi:hypothetical protein